jgi:GxxExxY protein
MITQKYINEISYEIVGCAIEVHKQIGPGLLESVYEKCLIHELSTNGFTVKTQVSIPLIYKGISLDSNLKLDVIVDDLVIIELKAVDSILPVFKAQLLSYLKMTGIPKGLLINFNCENITKDGLVPMVTEKFSQLPLDSKIKNLQI